MPLWKVVISQTLFGQLVQNRIWLQGEDFQEADEVCQQVKNNWITPIKFLQHNGLHYTSVSVRQFDAQPAGGATLALALTGGQAEETQGISFTCGLVHFSTGLTGKQFRGRYYLAGHRQGGTQFGQFTAAELALWETQMAILRNNFVGPTGGATGLSLFIRGEKVIHNTLVTDIRMTPILRCQRRRNIGVGS